MKNKVLFLSIIGIIIVACAGLVSAQNNATNPNGTTTFTTDKYVAIETMHPDIDILNFRLAWQNFTGTFDTTKGTCTGCSFDLGNATCQAEVEKIFGMFVSYNLTINLSTPSAINFTALNLECRTANGTIAKNPNCTSLFNPYNQAPYQGADDDNCITWVSSNNSVPGGWVNATATLDVNSKKVLIIDISQLNASVQFNMGTLTSSPTCEMIACELNGTWQQGNTETFTINKTITVTAN